jgi:hypothetical protein
MITPQHRLEIAQDIAHETAVRIVNTTEAEADKLGWIQTLIQTAILAAFHLEAAA